MQKEHVPLPSRTVLASVAGCFFLATLVVYWQSLFHPFVRWDDGLLIYDNPAVWAITPATLKAIFTSYDPELYIPLTFLSYQLDFLIGGTNASIYHLTNLILHTANALLAAWLAFLLSKNLRTGFICGMLFALHPLHAEAVAWASARKDVLSTFFFLLSIIGYISYRETGKHYTKSIAAFALALMAKVTVAPLPVLLLLLDFRERRQRSRTMYMEKIPYLLLSIVFGIIALFGKTTVLARATLLEKALMAGKSTVFYLEKLIFPTKLSVLYPYVGDISLSSPDFLLPACILLTLLALVLFSLKYTREIFFGFFFFLLTISPTFLNFAKGELDLYFASDRYAYAGSVGILFLAALGMQSLRNRIQPVAVSAGAAAVLVLFAWLAHAQSLTWQSTEALFGNVLEHYPQSHVAHNNLGNAYRRAGKLEESILHYNEAIALRDHPRTRSNLGAALRAQGRVEEALAEYTKALALEPGNKNAHFGLGILYAEQGAFDRAQQEYEQALAADRNYSEVYLNLGALYLQKGEVAKAVEHYEKAAEITPYYAQAHYNLGVAYTKLSRPRQALESYERAVQLEPSFVAARINLGILYYERKEGEKAIGQFEAVLRYDPGNARALSALEQIRRQL